MLFRSEGKIAALYFEGFSALVKTSDFDFNDRNRRPPKDPVNAMLSLGYSALTNEFTGLAYSVGLDPYCGILHHNKLGKPALALDLMEEFRPLIVDSVVLRLINTGEIKPSDFMQSARGCVLTKSGFGIFWKAYIERLSSTVTHPTFNYSCPYRSTMELQVRQLWRIFMYELDHYSPMVTR